LKALGIHQDEYRFDYVQLAKYLNECIELKNIAGYLKTIRWMSKQDLFFLCYFVLELPVNHPFLIARIYSAQDDHDFTVDLWAREHWKSTILSYALSIWQLLQSPEERIVIFSHTRVLAKSHLRRIKYCLEQNDILHKAFPEIFYSNPFKDAPKWSEDEGIYVKRTKNFAEASVEAWGLVDSSPIGKHYSVMIFDDLITDRTVNSTEMVRKATEAFKLSLNLGTRIGSKRIIGTRYSFKDPYSEIMKQKKWKPRVYPAEVDEEGTRKRGGIPVYLKPEELTIKYETQGEYIYSSQMLQDPTAESMQGFKEYWLKYWQKERPYMNLYIVVDPASSKRKDSDYTVMMVLGTDSLRNYYVLDMVRDKLDMGQKWTKLKDLVLEWGIKDVGYESVGMQSDMEYLNLMMEEQGVYFNLIKLSANVSKVERIRNLVPRFQSGRIIIPRALLYKEIDGTVVDLTEMFVREEYLAFPYSTHDDMLDVLSRITDSAMGITFPTRSLVTTRNYYADDPLDMNVDKNSGSWMAV
jgi:predicted phage terminase large subunit-like protein